MINTVVLQGVVTHSSWGKNKEEGGFFINLKHEKVFNQYKPSYSFSAYANRPLAGQLAKIVQENPGCTLIIEGELRTFYSKRTKFYQTTILITKIINWTKPKEISTK